MNKSDVINLCTEERFETLFTQYLGWNNLNDPAFQVDINDTQYSLKPISKAADFVALHCQTNGVGIPTSDIRRKIDQEVTKRYYEHIIIFSDGTKQTWQWVKRDKGSPNYMREHTFTYTQNGEAFLQRLNGLIIQFEELDSDGNINISSVVNRVQKALDVDRVTKRFYDKFAKQLKVFKAFIDGIPLDTDKDHYASLMLNRLMFIYFIQKKGFLDRDPHYLKNKLQLHLQNKVEGEFYTFYKRFLRRLFAEGLNSPDRNPELNSLFGNVPYLNGGLYEQHRIEQENSELNIPDEAFQKIFAFFDEYQWHLDDRPTRKDDEINPDVLGYIFEKFINQKQMGAYYTKEDITEYISKSTIIPYLFDELKKKCQFAFEGEHSVWKLLQANPANYIYAAMKRGVIDADGQVIPESALPEFVQTGMHDPNARMFDQNYNLKAADYTCEPYGLMTLPTETWREYAARRTRCQEVFEKLKSGEVQQINELITYNLDIRQFAQDVVESTEDPGLLNAVWKTLNSMSVLDPTCGSGAFLFAAMNILEPLYESAINRMEEYVEAWSVSGYKVHPNFFRDFQGVLQRIEKHPNTRYFVFKSIILNNLYGVDIMHEAVEICKLRLFLKLASLVEPDHTAANMGLEPLPDIDFNIKAGNTLVGFATEEEAAKAVNSSLLVDTDSMYNIKAQADDIEHLWTRFHEQQVSDGGDITINDKRNLQDRLASLADELSRYLAKQYIIDASRSKTKYDAWLTSHQPFHWFVEFYSIMRRGGFDVIIGNPPYVEISAIKDTYELLGLSLIKSGNLFAVCAERFISLCKVSARIGIIIPISAVSTPRMNLLMSYLENYCHPLHISNYAVRPTKLFVGVDMNLTICLGRKASSDQQMLYSTGYKRWYSEFRDYLFYSLIYAQTTFQYATSAIPKVHCKTEISILAKSRNLQMAEEFLSKSPNSDVVYYHSGGRYFRKCLLDKISNEYKELRLLSGCSSAFQCLLSSSYYYWFWIVNSDCYHVTKGDIGAVRLPPSLISSEACNELSQRLNSNLMGNSIKRIRNRAGGSQQNEVNFRVGLSKGIIDEIDLLLAVHYNFSDEELDFIINYDIKYRMGLSGESEPDSE